MRDNIKVHLTDEDLKIITNVYNIEISKIYKPVTIEELSNTRLLYEIITEGFNSIYDKFEEGGRWSNYKISVYKITETLFIEVYDEVPATEMQDSGDFFTEIYKVKPIEKVVIDFVRI